MLITNLLLFFFFFFLCVSLKEIDKENGIKTFSIETVEGKGVISLVGDLDYEKKSLYQLKILAIVSIIMILLSDYSIVNIFASVFISFPHLIIAQINHNLVG